MLDLVNNIRYTLRTLRKTPLVVAVTVASLAVGIGATTSVFSIANTFLFRPGGGIGEPEGVVALYTSKGNGSPHGPLSFPDYESIAGAVDALDGVTAFGLDAMSTGEGAGQSLLLTQVVAGNFFDVLEIKPALGRGFRPDEAVAGQALPVAVIGYDLWQGRFAGAPDVLGRSLELNGRPYTVVGVAPRGLGSRIFALKPDLWIPLGIPGASVRRSLAELGRREDRDYMALGRLREGATLPQVQAQLDVAATRLRDEYPEAWVDDNGRSRAFAVLSEKESRMPPGARAVIGVIAAFLLGVAGMILLIACANLAGLFLARAGGRSRELAVRLALGAGRRRLVGLLLAESLVLALSGGVGGIALTHLANRAMRSVSLPLGIPVLKFDFALDWRVVAFALTVTVLAGLAFGLGPALAGARLNLVAALKSDSRSGGRRTGRWGLRNLLIIAQVAASLALLAGAALFLRSMQGAAKMDVGMNPERIAVMSKVLRPEQYSSERGRQYLRDLSARLRATSGVEDVQMARGVELTLLGAEAEERVAPAGGPVAEDAPEAHSNAVTPGYLTMLQVPLLRGRTLESGDVEGAPLVAVVNQTFAERLWPGRDALGERFTVRGRAAREAEGARPDRTFEVVGITRDGKYLDIDDREVAYFWTSLYQDYSPRVAILVKGRPDAETMVKVLRREVQLSTDEIGFVAPDSLASMLELQVLHLRLAAKVMGWGGGFGLFLAIIGVYGVVSVVVAQRSREMAVRLALGAGSGRVFRLVVGDGMRLVGVGVVLGLAGAVPMAVLVKSQLFGMSPLDPLALGGSALVITVAALVASALPALRVRGIEPVEVLRQD